MNQPLKPEDFLQSVPLLDRPRPWTRHEKLQHWAKIVRQWSGPRLQLMHGLEYACYADLTRVPLSRLPTTAMTVAALDPEFNRQGLNMSSSIIDLMRFMNITQRELHEFSCDCGGPISKEHQAERIEHL